MHENIQRPSDIANWSHFHNSILQHIISGIFKKPEKVKEAIDVITRDRRKRILPCTEEVNDL